MKRVLLLLIVGAAFLLGATARAYYDDGRCHFTCPIHCPSKPKPPTDHLHHI